MNISFFLKPKVEVSYLTESCPVQKAIDDMLHSGFTAIPVVDAKGKYAGTITEGDFLRLVLHYPKEIPRTADRRSGRAAGTPPLGKH